MKIVIKRCIKFSSQNANKNIDECFQTFFSSWMNNDSINTYENVFLKIYLIYKESSTKDYNKKIFLPSIILEFFSLFYILEIIIGKQLFNDIYFEIIILI